MLQNTATFSYTQTDLVVAQRAWWSSVARWQTFLRTGAILWAIYAMLGIIGAMIGGDDLSQLWPPIIGYTLPIAFGVMIVLYAIGYFLTPWRARKAFREHKALGGEFRYRWDAEGFRIEHETGTTALPWPMLHDWFDGPSTLMLFQSSNLFNAIPKRALTDDKIADIIAHLREADVTERKRFGIFASRQPRRV